MERKFTFCIRFQLGNSFVNAKVERTFTLCIRFQLGNSFVNAKVPRTFTLCICFQLGNSFGNAKVPRKFTLCIRFQVGNSCVNTKVPNKFTLCIRFQLWNQRKIYEQIKEIQMKTTVKPMKIQRRTNEQQWKGKDNFASILSYLLPGIFGPCFFEGFIFNGERNKRQF